MPKQDAAQVAHRVFLESIQETPEDVKQDAKDPAAVKLGRKGGESRAASLSAERRLEIAKQAAQARWKQGR